MDDKGYAEITCVVIRIWLIHKKNYKRAQCQKVKAFTKVNDRLHHKGCKGKIQQVVKAAEVQDLLQQTHASVVGGCHFGQYAMHRKTAERFWWPTMMEDMRHIIRTCER